MEIKEKPREYECILRQRIEEIVSGELFRKGLVPDANTAREIVAAIPKVEGWLTDWGSFGVIAQKDFSELSKMMPIAPILWRKAYDMLKCYCMLKLRNMSEAEKFFHAYMSENGNLDFSAVDRYLETLLKE